MMHCAHGEEGWDGGQRGITRVRFVGQHDALAAAANGSFGGGAQGLDACVQGARRGITDVLSGNAHRLEAGVRHDRVDVLIEEHGGLDVHARDVLGAFVVKQVALGTERDLERHHQALAKGVNGGVGDLRESLLEVIIHEVRAAGQHGHGGVVSHAPRGLAPVCRHRLNDHAHVLRRESSDCLRLDEGGGAQLGRAGGLGRHHLVHALHPAVIVAARRHFLGHFGVLLEHARLQIGLDHHTRAEAAFGHDVGGVGDDVAQDADLGRDVDVVVRCAPEARGTQTVAVEAAPQLFAVGEHQQRRSVPRLLHSGEVVVEARHLGERGVQLGVVAVRLGHQQHHSLCHGASTLHQQLRHAVKVC
mmetsp:Transcript_36134/g.58077  ORF Transcript_36134/g.58077 Transcript_36134/m.58077 type:complete len:360 (-) Transcript_36134:977-2056(-)